MTMPTLSTFNFHFASESNNTTQVDVSYLSALKSKDPGLDSRTALPVRTPSPPSTSSTCSTCSKRSFSSLASSDDNGYDRGRESSGCEHERKRPRRSLSPFQPYRLYVALGVDAFLSPPGDLLVDKTKYIIDLPDTFQCLVLRPPQFGKTMLLSTLYHFYDSHGATLFDQRFASRAVVTAATAPVPHSQHLSLMFDLSDVRVYCNIAGVTASLTNKVFFILVNFLEKYAEDLELSKPGTYLVEVEHDLKEMLTKVFNLAKACGRTLFVGVDNYDAPTQTSTLMARSDLPLDLLHYATVVEIEEFLDSRFWRPLMAASSVIHKLCVTGVLRVNYPALQHLEPNVMPAFHNACGYTDDEALYFTRALLEDPPTINDLHYTCGHYVFPFENPGGILQSFIHPRLLTDYINDMCSPNSLDDDQSFVLLSNFLELVPDHKTSQGIIADDLITLLATGAIDVADELLSPFDFDATRAVTWSMLRLAGGLTCDRETEATLRISSPTVLSLIHSRVDKIVADRYDLHEFVNAWSCFSLNGNPRLLLDMISMPLRELTQRCFGKREPNLQGIFELVFRNNACGNNECLVEPLVLVSAIEGTSVEIQAPSYQPDEVYTMKLTTLSLRGMWLALHPNDDEPTPQNLEDLFNDLLASKEEALLDMQYQAWSPTLDAMEMRRVGSFFDDEPSANPHFLAVGGAHTLMRHPPPEQQRDDDFTDYDAEGFF